MFNDFYKLPEPYKDAIHATVDIHLDWLDRVRVLLFGVVSVRVTTLCENKPGMVESKSEVTVRRSWGFLRRRSADVGYIAEEKRR